MHKKTDKTVQQHAGEENRKPDSRKKKRTKILYTVCMIVLLCIFVGCGLYLAFYYWQSKKSEDRVDELKALIIEDDSDESEPDTGYEGTPTDAKPKTEYVEIDGVLVQKKFEQLYTENHDFIGWLTIDDMVIDYPVMQSMYDEEFYLHKDFDKKYSNAGTLFIDTSSDVREPSDNLIIYGHHMQTGKMFGELESYAKQSFYEEHKYISFDTIYGDGTYEVIAAFYTKIYEREYTGFKYYQFFDAENEAEFNSFVSNCKDLTGYEIPATAVYGDKLITLSTCAYHTDNGRFVVVAKKIADE